MSSVKAERTRTRGRGPGLRKASQARASRPTYSCGKQTRRVRRPRRGQPAPGSSPRDAGFTPEGVVPQVNLWPPRDLCAGRPPAPEARSASCSRTRSRHFRARPDTHPALHDTSPGSSGQGSQAEFWLCPSIARALTGVPDCTCVLPAQRGPYRVPTGPHGTAQHAPSCLKAPCWRASSRRLLLCHEPHADTRRAGPRPPEHRRRGARAPTGVRQGRDPRDTAMVPSVTSLQVNLTPS